MKKSIAVFGLYCLITVVYTYPLIFKLGSAIYGYAGDNLGTTHYLWWWKYTFLNHLDLRNSFWEQAPFGFKIDSETGTVFYYWPLKLLTLVFNELGAYNLMLFLSFPLAALAVYFFTKDFQKIFISSQKISGLAVELVSFWAGFVFSFSPYHFWKAYNHLDLALIWPFPLALLYFLRVLKDPSAALKFRAVIPVAILTAVTILTNFYYGFFLLLTIFLLAIFYYLVFRSSLKKTLSTTFFSCLLTLVFVAPFIAPTVYDAYVTKGKDQSAARVANYNRPLLDLISLSARPWDYVIPSQDNPIFGRHSTRFYQWIVTKGRDFKVVSGPVHERTIFLGFVSIFLLVFNSYLLIFNSDFRRESGRVSVLLWLVILSLFIISLPPYVFVKGRYTLYLPSYLLFKLIPVFRTYSRLGIFVFSFVILLASTVLGFLSRKFSKRKLVTFYLLLISLSAAEFANVPPSKVIDLKEPSALNYLGQKREAFNFVVYPKEFNVAELLVFQPQFQKGFLNFHSQSPYYQLWDFLADFRNPKAYSLLSALGIKYAVFQKKLIFASPNPVDDLWYTRALNSPLGTLPPGLTLEKDYEDSSVYKVTAEPVGFVVATQNRVDSFPRTPLGIKGETFRIYFANLDKKKDLSLNLELTSRFLKSSVKLNLNGESLTWRIQNRRDGQISISIQTSQEESFLDVFLAGSKDWTIDSLGTTSGLTQTPESAIIK